LELSRQRLRSSLIERSFQKCHYCEGSGIILNSNSIIEQIIKVIKEKLISANGSEIQVKCNSALAEALMNTKKDEIIDLENNNKTKISFKFDDHFSFHEPVIELGNQNIKKVNNLIDDKKIRKNNKKSISKLKKQVRKKKTTKKNIQTKKAIVEDDKNNIPEKTGWWSE